MPKAKSGSYKTAKTIKEYRVKFGPGHLKYTLTVPVGSTVSNMTAMGYDDNYRFLHVGSTKVLTGMDWESPCLAHDLKYYGLNVPAEYCEPYPEKQ